MIHGVHGEIQQTIPHLILPICPAINKNLASFRRTISSPIPERSFLQHPNRLVYLTTTKRPPVFL